MELVKLVKDMSMRISLVEGCHKGTGSTRPFDRCNSMRTMNPWATARPRRSRGSTLFKRTKLLPQKTFWEAPVKDRTLSRFLGPANATCLRQDTESTFTEVLSFWETKAYVRSYLIPWYWVGETARLIVAAPVDEVNFLEVEKKNDREWVSVGFYLVKKKRINFLGDGMT